MDSGSGTGGGRTAPAQRRVIRHAGPRPVALADMALATVVYCLLGALSLSTAYVQANAATVWMPSGFALGLLLVRGRGYWPAVALGAFLVNATVNLVHSGATSPGPPLLAALMIAAGNTAEVLIGVALTRRLAGGAEMLNTPRGVVRFVGLIAPLAAAASAGIGIPASWVGGVAVARMVPEALLTWYVANAVGILIFTGPTILVLKDGLSPLPRRQYAEAAALLLCLVFASQAVSGIYFADALEGWPKAYMIIPLLFWASFRFGTQGALLSAVLIVLISALGTLRGFSVFPAETPSRSLIYLQVYLAMLSLMALSIAASRHQVEELQAGLEKRVRERTAEVERLLREKEVFTTVVAHDLQSPLYGVRNALRASTDAIRAGRIGLDEIAAAMAIMEESCTSLATRVAALLAPEGLDEKAAPAAKRMRVVNLLANIVAAHRLGIDRKALTVTFVGDKAIALRRPVEVEHILDVLIENAIRHSPEGAKIEVAAYGHSGMIDLLVSDDGEGVGAAEIPYLFQPKRTRSNAGQAPRQGLGLSLASEMAERLGGSLSYSPRHPQGACFRLSLSAALSGEGDDPTSR